MDIEKLKKLKVRPPLCGGCEFLTPPVRPDTLFQYATGPSRKTQLPPRPQSYLNKLGHFARPE